MVCLPAAGVGIATLHVFPEASSRAGIGFENDASSTETLTERFTLAVYDGSSTHDFPEKPMKPASTFGPWMWTRRSSACTSAPARVPDGWNEKGIALSEAVGS